MTAGAVSAPLIIPIIHLQTHRAKNHIDTNTPVSIQSDTPDVLVFFTLDGSRPAGGPRGSVGGSRKYTGPILLPAGRVAVRAVAVTRDGRDSSTVTKVFLVEHADSNNRKENEDNFLQSDQRRPSEGTSLTSAGPSLRTSEPRIMGNASPPSGPRFLTSRLGSPTKHQPTGSSQHSQSASSGVLKQLSSMQTSRIHREIDFLRCAQCLSPRPSDPFSRFCPQCGSSLPPLPEQRLPPAEGGQMLCCVFCNSLVPVNTHTCLICEASIYQQLQPQSSRTLKEHVVCVSCGSGNPAHVSSCLTCENRVQPNGAPSVRPADGRMLTCSRCKRLNRGDARFCDWCGSKPGHAASCVVCRRCGASGHLYAFYCAACGGLLEAPPPPTSRMNITQPVRGRATDQASATTSHDATWQATPSSGPAPRTKIATPTAEQSTQTVGLYYPSATELQRKETQAMLQLSKQQTTRDRQPLLTAISPGRGFWRKQLDHLCAHLRSYAQNNAPFRTLLGEPRLGQMVSAVIQEDRYEVSVTVSFVSAGREERQVDPAGPAGRTETLSMVTERSADSSSLRSDPPKPNRTPKPPVRDVQLLKELGPGPGRGQISVVQQLLDQGADPSCCDGDGRHALAVAVVNGHHEALPVLVQRGADVDQQSGRMKNTALHEAAALGSEGLKGAQVLLSFGAGVRRRNAGGQTAYDVAVTSGCDLTVSLLAARTGLDLLGRLGKPRGNPDVSS
ncbi:double zinc ribbon and ankyrin repeat-containing protein 1-like isoform X2 [Anoplopoma fimbria]|uniref:double zinc ribbon and ankyrin repeat-containing protein 1-like isoform X2 n=2 Tax=Anoplopoma fimbria TaxID=229290 RepID=UPI0023EB8F8C|nr:double zinc ribbon and ankyrin repeat-containing protein 1-like isoform X2 [Anoplopoma fimbria]